MIERGKLKFEQCFNGIHKGVYFKIGRKREIAYFKKDIQALERSIEMMATLGYITKNKYEIIKNDIVAFKKIIKQPKTLTDGSIRK
jgi:hypothetical protein